MPEEKRTYESGTIALENARLIPRPGRGEESSLPHPLDKRPGHSQPHLGSQVSREVVLRLIGMFKED